MARIFVSTSSKSIAMGRITALTGVVNATLTGWYVKPSAANRGGWGQSRVGLAYGLFAYPHSNGNFYVGATTAAAAGYGYFAYNGTVWTHIAVVFDGSQTGDANRLKAYLNGVEQTIIFAAAGVPAAIAGTMDAYFYIGRVESSSTIYTDGSHGNVRLYLASLSQGQVQSDMLGLLPIKPLGNWPLGMASPEPDLSGNGYAGTLVNTPVIADHCPAKCFTSMGVGR
jgi:hypothetical protein